MRRNGVNMKDKKTKVVQLIVSIIGVFITLFGVVLFNRYLLMSFPIGARMILMLASRWILFLVPGIMMWVNKEKMIELGFHKKYVTYQIGIGIIVAVLMSLLFTVIPILLGFRDMVGSTQYTKVWQFSYEFVYTIFGVALTEELIFRGYIFNKLLQIKDNKVLAIIISSVMFGFFHVFSGDVIQVIMTTIIGIVYCVLREKIKNCTTLSLIIIHGVYDALIILWVFIL